ncbi:hypothetical protein [Streptomyces roseoverticillatus]|uniref:Uncharacterized protein n=1 Tax=Streptomyces roseoverticillatus TaxID=66429 RepID=A0ABV3IUR4_9ACTN
MIVQEVLVQEVIVQEVLAISGGRVRPAAEAERLLATAREAERRLRANPSHGSLGGPAPEGATA